MPPQYKDSFSFNPKDIDLIERALRDQVRVCSRILLALGNEEGPAAADTEARLRELTNLLGKIHNQKIFYGQAHPTGAPISG